MPDWNSKVSQKLENSKFSGEERQEISRELGDYLEDSPAGGVFRLQRRDERGYRGPSLPALRRGPRRIFPGLRSSTPVLLCPFAPKKTH